VQKKKQSRNLWHLADGEYNHEAHTNSICPLYQSIRSRSLLTQILIVVATTYKCTLSVQLASRPSLSFVLEPGAAPASNPATPAGLRCRCTRRVYPFVQRASRLSRLTRTWRGAALQMHIRLLLGPPKFISVGRPS
jgi:hypothetical protein